MRTIFNVLIVSLFLTACGEKFRGDFVGEARPVFTSDDCGVNPDENTVYNIRVAGGISSSKASLRVIELEPKGGVNRGGSTAESFARYFRGFEIRANVINKETLLSEGNDTIYRVADRANQNLDNIDDKGRFVQNVTEEFDIVTTAATVNRARDEITNMEIERRTLIKGQNGDLECTVSLFVPSMSLEK